MHVPTGGALIALEFASFYFPTASVSVVSFACQMRGVITLQAHRSPIVRNAIRFQTIPLFIVITSFQVIGRLYPSDPFPVPLHRVYDLPPRY